MKVRLEVSHKSGKKKIVNIQSDAVIGRSTECSLRIASSEISRKHCKLTVIDSGVLVRDLESANGTWVNGKMIPPARDVALRPGSRLSIGPVQFVVHYESSNPAIDEPGSTVELPAVPDMPDPETPGAPIAAVTDEPAVEAEAPPEVPEFDPAGEESDAIETVVVEPGAVQEMLADSFPDLGGDSEVADVEEAVVGDVVVDVDDGETAEVEAPEVENATEAEADETETDVPAGKKGKRGSLFGGLFKFGRKKKEESAATEPAEPEAAAEVEAEQDVVETVAEEEAAEVNKAETEEDETEYVDEGEEGYYEDEEEVEEEYEEEEEIDEELGDFFSQFEDK